MNLREPQIEPDEKEPFKNCKLNRKQYADALESIVSNTSEGCVIALNGAWGTGKTTFVRMWEQQLKNDGYKTAYFNAWETDFVSDPLVALIGELGKIVKEGDENEKLKKVKKIGREFLSNSSLKIASGILRLCGLGNVADGGNEIIEGIKSLFAQELNDYENECKGFDDFKKSLSALVGDIDQQKPLVFIVDELDRCNPHYAVRLLERVKHLFSLSRIVFVLCIDKEQLGHSICGYYGSDKINAQEYLRRFIDVDYYLPEPDYAKFVDFLYSKLKFKPLFSADKKEKPRESKLGPIYVALLLFKSSKLPLRQMDKILTHIRLVAQTFSKKEDIHINLIILLVYLRWFHLDIYRKIRFKEYGNIQSLVDEIEGILPNALFQTTAVDSNASPAIALAVANLLYFYNPDQCVLPPPAFSKDMDFSVGIAFHISFIDEDEMREAIDYYAKHAPKTEDILPNTIKHIEILYELQPEI